jgi:asparagine synthase (glutamine-hydrolysing)
MSGIVGILSTDEKNILPKMFEKIKHRGTSKPVMWTGPYGALGASGISGVNEIPGPAITPSGDRAIVMDGRFSNYQQLLGMLEVHQLEEDSDTEVILHAFEDLGSRLFDILEGEFALAIFDKNRMILARDRLGIRPLYYGFRNGDLCFASEIKALVEIVDEVHEFPPGYFLDSEKGLFPYQPYLPEDVQPDGALDSAKQLADHLVAAVERAIPEGAQVGVWLSGGVDSSIVAALARNYVEKLYTFSAGVEDGPDLAYARQVAQHIGSEHYEKIYSFDEMLAVLEKVIYHLETFDAPLVRSAVANFMVSELASDYVPFVLSGEGGDELFAGYSYQKEHESEVELLLSVQNAIGALHNTALQRVDRSAAAHSTAVGVPFLDPAVVRYALAVPVRWKIRGPDSIEKWPLRKSLEEMLPEDIIWREKAKFWEGAGSANFLAVHAQEVISDEEFEKERNLSKDFRLRSKEELLYYRIFKRLFGDKVPLVEIGRTQHI